MQEYSCKGGCKCQIGISRVRFGAPLILVSQGGAPQLDQPVEAGTIWNQKVPYHAAPTGSMTGDLEKLRQGLRLPFEQVGGTRVF